MGASKENGGLYDEYLRRTGADPSECLHIGDNRYADGEAAENKGISTCQIYSGYQMLEESAAQGLLQFEKTDADALSQLLVLSRLSVYNQEHIDG